MTWSLTIYASCENDPWFGWKTALVAGNDIDDRCFSQQFFHDGILNFLPFQLIALMIGVIQPLPYGPELSEILPLVGSIVVFCGLAPIIVMAIKVSGGKRRTTATITRRLEQ